MDFLLKSESDTFTIFKEWNVLSENQTGKKIKILRTDNGLEFCNSEFDQYCSKQGIIRHKTVSYAPQHNGVANRLNRTILEKTRCVLISFSLLKIFWGEVVKLVCYLINRCSSSLNNKIP